jgi:hypothetical protein
MWHEPGDGLLAPDFQRSYACFVGGGITAGVGSCDVLGRDCPGLPILTLPPHKLSAMVRVVTVAAGPDWASATTAIGTVAVAVVAVGVAFFADLRARRRLREERKRSDDLLSEERALHAKEIAEERALASQRLRDQFAHSDAQLAEERAHSAAQLQEDRLWNRGA